MPGAASAPGGFLASLKSITAAVPKESSLANPHLTMFLLAVAVGLSGCADQPSAGSVREASRGTSAEKVTRIEAGPDAPKQAQTALIKAKPGEVIEFGPGRFDFTSTLSLDVSSRDDQGPGAGQDDPGLQEPGTGHRRRRIAAHEQGGCHLQDLAIEDAKGDAVKVSGTKGLVIRDREDGVDRGTR